VNNLLIFSQSDGITDSGRIKKKRSKNHFKLLHIDVSWQECGSNVQVVSGDKD
jgi:hypothetical protein